MLDHTAAALCPPSLSLSFFLVISLALCVGLTVSMEPNSPKKIQFAVPLFQSHLDPQAAEHIRKRRPTPATLVIYNDPNASDDKQSTSSSQAENQSAQLSPAQRKTSVYTPPTMRGREQTDTQRTSQEESIHPQKLPHPQLATLSEEPADALPRRKDTPYQQEAPFTTGVRVMKGQMESSSAFQEDEESSCEKIERQAE